MILDKQEEFSDSQSLIIAVGNAISTNVIDTGLIQYPFDIAQSQASGAGLSGTVSTRDLGIGEPIWFVVEVDTAAVGATATLTISLESSAVAALTSSTVHYTTTAIAVTALTAGAVLAAVMLPSGNYKQFLGVRYTVGTANLTAGAISAFLTRNIQKNVNYPKAYSQL